jgi:NhaP-type Na+/H+ or K+/H+ antiporter
LIRPVAVYVGLIGTSVTSTQRRLTAWFGIRGVGSVYYLSYAIEHGLSPADSQTLAALVLATVAVSVVVHGMSVTPLMDRYVRRTQRGQTSSS